MCQVCFLDGQQVNESGSKKTAKALPSQKPNPSQNPLPPQGPNVSATKSWTASLYKSVQLGLLKYPSDVVPTTVVGLVDRGDILEELVEKVGSLTCEPLVLGIFPMRYRGVRGSLVDI